MKTLIVVLLGLALHVSQTEAAMVTKSYNFSAAQFAPAGALSGTIVGSFSFTYDDNIAFVNDVVPDSVSLTITATPYSTTNTRVDVQSLGGAAYEIVFGGLTGENQEVYPGIPNDFILTFRQEGGVITTQSFRFTEQKFQIFNAQMVSVTDVTASPPPHAVPIPNVALAFMAMSIGLIASRRMNKGKA